MRPESGTRKQATRCGVVAVVALAIATTVLPLRVARAFQQGGAGRQRQASASMPAQSEGIEAEVRLTATIPSEMQKVGGMHCTANGPVTVEWRGTLLPEHDKSEGATRVFFRGVEEVVPSVPSRARCFTVAPNGKEEPEIEISLTPERGTGGLIIGATFTRSGAPELTNVSFSGVFGKCAVIRYNYEADVARGGRKLVNKAQETMDFRGTVELQGPGDASYTEYFDPPSFSRGDFERGFTRVLRVRRAPAGSMCDFPWFAWTDGIITLRYKAAPRPVLTLAGCADVAVGGSGTVTATAKPAGGKFRFWTDDAERVVEVAPLGASASLTGLAPGRGTLHVEYTAPDGQTVTESKSLSCARVVSLNGGSPVVQLGWYDAQGKKLTATRDIPVVVEPQGEAGLLNFIPASPLISAVGIGDQLRLQGLQLGRTTLQGQTQCGQKTGPVLTVEVVPCDNEVIAELRRQHQQASSRLANNRKQQTEITADEEFDRAAREGAKHIGELAEKTQELVIATAGAGKGAPAAVKELSAAMDRLSVAKDLLTGNYGSAQLQTLIIAADIAIAGVVKTGMEAADLAAKVGQDLGTMVGAANQLESLQEQEKKTQSEVAELERRLFQLCRAPRSGQGTKEPSAEPSKPGESPPPRSEQPPKGKEPASGEKSTAPQQKPGTQQGESGAGRSSEPPNTPPSTPPDQPPPKPGSGRGGGYQIPSGSQTDKEEGGACGCGAQPALGVASTGGAAGARAVFNAAAECTRRYRGETLGGLQRALGVWPALKSDLTAANKLPDAERARRMGELTGRAVAIAGALEKANGQVDAFQASLDGCAPAVGAAVGVVQQAKERK